MDDNVLGDSGVDGETSISDHGRSLVAETGSNTSDSDSESDDGSHEPSFRWHTSPLVWTLSWLQRKSSACEDPWNGHGVIEVNTVTDKAAYDESVWKICFTGIYHGRLQSKNLLLEISGPFATQYLSKDCILKCIIWSVDRWKHEVISNIALAQKHMNFFWDIKLHPFHLRNLMLSLLFCIIMRFVMHLTWKSCASSIGICSSLTKQCLKIDSQIQFYNVTKNK